MACTRRCQGTNNRYSVTPQRQTARTILALGIQSHPRGALSIDSFPQINLQPFLHNKEGGMVLQRPTWMRQGDFVFPQYLDQNLVHLEERQIAPDAKMAAASELSMDTSAFPFKLSLPRVLCTTHGFRNPVCRPYVPDTYARPSASHRAQTTSRAGSRRHHRQRQLYLGAGPIH